MWLVTYILDARFHPEFIKAAIDRARRGVAFRIVAWLVPSGRAADDPADLREGGDGLRWYLGVTFFPSCPAASSCRPSSPSIRPPHSSISPTRTRHPPAAYILTAAVLPRLALAFVGGPGRGAVGPSSAAGPDHGAGKALATNTGPGVAGTLFFVLAGLYVAAGVLVRHDVWQPPPVTAACMVFGLFAGLFARDLVTALRRPARSWSCSPCGSGTATARLPAPVPAPGAGVRPASSTWRITRSPRSSSPK